MRTTAQYFFSGEEFHNQFQGASPFVGQSPQSVEFVTQILLEVVWQGPSGSQPVGVRMPLQLVQ